MKKIVLNVALVSLSFLSLYAFVHLKSSSSLLLQYARESACDAEEIVDGTARYEICSEENSQEVTRHNEPQQKVLEETIPRFHQQLSTFVPF